MVQETVSTMLEHKSISMIKLLFFDTTSFNKKNKNTATILVTDYICTIWNNRDNHCDKIYLLKKRILQHFQYSQYISENKLEQLFSRVYCNINQRILDNIDCFLKKYLVNLLFFGKLILFQYKKM